MFRAALVTVKYDELLDGGTGMKYANSVIAADGANSAICHMVMLEPNRRYPGYLACPGTVPENEVSKTLRQLVGTRKTM